MFEGQTLTGKGAFKYYIYYEGGTNTYHALYLNFYSNEKWPHGGSSQSVA